MGLQNCRKRRCPDYKNGVSRKAHIEVVGWIVEKRCEVPRLMFRSTRKNPAEAIKEGSRIRGSVMD